MKLEPGRKNDPKKCNNTFFEVSAQRAASVVKKTRDLRADVLNQAKKNDGFRFEARSWKLPKKSDLVPDILQACFALQ